VLWLLSWWKSDRCWCLKLCSAGVDPKSIVCEFFKVGQCQKGFKCKFSHDLNVQRKGEKIDIYTDKRDAGIGQTLLGLSLSSVQMVLYKFIWYLLLPETMEDWDQETLEKVVESKRTEYQQNKPTDIVRTTLSLFCCQSLILSCQMSHHFLCSFACHSMLISIFIKFQTR